MHLLEVSEGKTESNKTKKELNTIADVLTVSLKRKPSIKKSKYKSKERLQEMHQ